MSIGIVGLGSMGKNLAINISKKHTVTVYNRSPDKLRDLKDSHPSIKGTHNLNSFVSSMKQPRTIITMLPHGQPSTDITNQLSTILSTSDTIVDCANEHYDTSSKRALSCKNNNVNYLGVGMSGGANGALEGPAIMIGGDANVYQKHKEFFESFCNSSVYIDENPSHGHFVKMVHNGIEYSMLQAISDVFSYFDQDEVLMQQFIDSLSYSPVYGFLINNANTVLEKYNIQLINDTAHMNNTGLWCTQYSQLHNISTPTINAAVEYRIASKNKYFIQCHKHKGSPSVDYAFSLIHFVYAHAILEGLSLIKHKGIDVCVAQKAWSTSTIIECPMIQFSELNLLNILNAHIDFSRKFLIESIHRNVSTPSISAAIQHYDFIRTDKTSMNFLMAQRNLFGQHPFI
jgi:6-phosphogluconate dehydrogenase